MVPRTFVASGLARSPETFGLWRTAWGGIVPRFVGSFSQFAIFVLFARIMSEEEFGRLGWTYGLAMTLAVVASLGQGPVVARSWHLWTKQGDANITAIRGLQIAYGTAVLGSAALALVFVTIQRVGVELLPSSELVLASLLLVAVYALSEVQSYAIRAHGRIVAALAPRDVGWRVVVGTLAAIASFGGNQVLAETVLWLMVVSLLLIVLLQAAAWTRALHWSSIGVTRGSGERFDWLQWRALTLSVWLSSMATAFIQHADVALVGWTLGPADAALYTASARVCQILQLLPTALTAVFIPYAARLGDNKGRRGLMQLVIVNNRIVFLPAYIMTLFLVAEPALVLHIYGQSYAEAASCLRILAVGHLVAILCGPVVPICVGAGHQRAYAVATTLAAVLLGPAVWLLATWFGVVGAATASALSVALPPLAIRVWLRWRTGLDTSRLRAL